MRKSLSPDSSSYFSNAGIEQTTLPAPPLIKNALDLLIQKFLSK
jgi:hypothetical protein